MAPETPKGASSRLLSMKFMQRAAASTGTTPGSGSDAPSSKKRKLGNSDDYDLNINSASIQAAIDERDAKREAALEQHASNDTHWVLDTKMGKRAGKTEKKPMKVLYVGYGDFDSGDENEDKTQSGRTSTKKQKKTEGPTSDSSSDEQDQDEDGGAAIDGRKRKRDSTASSPRSRSASRSNSKQTPEADRAREFRDKRKKKDVKINQITSISNQGSAPSHNSAMTCYICQQKGHKASDCPRKGSQKSKGKR